MDLEKEGRVWGETDIFFVKILWPWQKAKDNSVTTIQTECTKKMKEKMERNEVKYLRI